MNHPTRPRPRRTRPTHQAHRDPYRSGAGLAKGARALHVIRSGNATVGTAKRPAPPQPPRHRPFLVIALTVAALTATSLAVGTLTARLMTPPSSVPAVRATPERATTKPAVVSQEGPAPMVDIDWINVAGLAVPVSTVAGPRHREGGRATGFTHDDAGAALAAVNLLVRTFPSAGPAVFRPTITDQVIGTDGATLLAETEQAYTNAAHDRGITGGAPLTVTGGAVTGFRFANGHAGPDHRIVYVLIRSVTVAELATAQGRDSRNGIQPADVALVERLLPYIEYEVDVVWQDGDWKLVAPPWGDWRGHAQALRTPDPSHYSAFASLAATAQGGR